MKAAGNSVLSCLTRLAWPWAYGRARRGYFRPLPPHDWSARRLALIACHWIGDTFWATQVVPALRQRFPAAELLAVTKPPCVDLWEGLIDRRHVIPAPAVVSDRRRERVSWHGLQGLARRLREHELRDVDLVIDLTGNRYSALFTFLLRPKLSLGFDGGELGWLYSHRVAAAERPGRHLAERPFRVIEPLLADATAPESTPPAACVCPPRPPRLPASQMPPTETPPAVIAPGAGWPSKRWPADRFIQTARVLCRTLPIVVVGSRAEEHLCERIAEPLDGAEVRTGLPLAEVIGLLSVSAGLVANDSGLAHLAAAMGRPTAVVFTGATDPALCAPLGPPGAVRVFDSHAAPEAVAGHLLGR